MDAKDNSAEEIVHDDIEIVRTRDGKFVGTAMVLGVEALPFVDSSTDGLAIEKRRTKDALYARISRIEKD